MKLSIVILFCDKDVKYLNDLLKQLEGHVFCEHEIVLIDNRTEDKTEISTKYKIVKPIKNIYLFEGRRVGFENSSGDYIWFVDVDDEIIGDVYEDDFNQQTDVIQFYYDADGWQIPPGAHKPLNWFGNGVWSRFFKATKLQEVYKPITKRNLKVHTFEDVILTSLIFQTNPSYSYIDRMIYKYRIDRSNMGKIKKQQFTKKDFDRYTSGYDELPYLFSFCKNEKELTEKAQKKYEYLLKKLTKK